MSNDQMRMSLAGYRAANKPHNNRRVYQLVKRSHGALVFPSKGGRQNLCRLTYRLTKKRPAGSHAGRYRLPAIPIPPHKSLFRPAPKPRKRCRKGRQHCGSICIPAGKTCRTKYSARLGRYLIVRK
jgi:hypothetical protein